MELYYKESGDKDASLLVFLHGGGVSSWMWDKQIAYFSDYHCLVLDLPEQGLSKNSLPFSIENSAESIIKLIEKIGKKEVIVIGFSLGAQIIIKMLSIRPNIIDYAIINSALVRPMKFGQKMIKPLIKWTYPLIKYRWFSKLQAKSLHIGDDYFEKYYEESRQMSSKTLIRILEENMAFEIPSSFEQATAKILVTVGARERKVMKASAIDIVNNNKNCEGIFIPKVGHGVMFSEPDFFNLMINNWLIDGEVPARVKLIIKD